MWRLGSEEADAGFRAEIERVSLLSLRTVGGLEFVMPLLMLAAGFSIIPISITDNASRLPNILFAALGAITLAAAWTPFGRTRARTLTAISIWVSVAIMIWSSLRLAGSISWFEHHIVGYMMLVLFGAAGGVPLKPRHMLILGISLDAFYFVSLLIARDRLGWVDAGVGALQHVLMLGVTILCTALTTSVYRQRYQGYRLHQDTRAAQSRLLISENAAVMGRVAAGLSHELNSPIGVLSSAVDTLGELAERMARGTPEQQARWLQLAADVRRSGRESVQRLQGIVGRMQRFTNLDRADVQSASLSDLLADVIAMVASEERRRGQINADLQPVPHILCRPQQLSAVFSNLLSNALDATEDSEGHVRVTARATNSTIEVRIEDNGSGIPPERMQTLFDPGAFSVQGSRMAAGGWSLFSSRQIVREHGGDIAVDSAQPSGTVVTVTLPWDHHASEQTDGTDSRASRAGA